LKDVNELLPDPTGRRWLYAFSIGIVALYGVLFAAFLFRSGPEDYDQFLVFHELQYWNTALFGMAKQWTPLMCGGLSLAGEPQVPFLSLSMALGYVLGPFWGLKLATLLYFIVGWVGAFLYAGLWLKQVAQRALAAALFIGNGFFFCRFGFGHIDFIPFLILPLMLWALHYAVAHYQAVGRLKGALGLAVITVLMGGAIAVAIDGSPVAIIHLLFWIGLYALVVAWTIRSFIPVLLLSCSVVLAAVLDAGYLWPMLQSQAAFPRSTPDRFTSVLSLLWFAVLPVRGKLLPANGNGHELSVFIGPVIALLLWRYRHWLAASMPPAIKRPLLIVSIVSIVLGMGSLKPLHIPVWLSPFDLLRPLPGFRSMGVTGRYWGFLALPLSLLGAAALWRFVVEQQAAKRRRVWLACALFLQLGFQTETIVTQWIRSSSYHAVDFDRAFQEEAQDIEYVSRNGHFQGEVITPTRGVVDCYDEDDFIHADIRAGERLIQRVAKDGYSAVEQLLVNAEFVSWSHIRVKPDRSLALAGLRSPNTVTTHVQLTLQQAFHPLWQAQGCETLRSEHGNMIVDCPESRLHEGPIDLKFNDATSARAAIVSMRAWRLWLLTTSGLLLVLLGALVRARTQKDLRNHSRQITAE